MFATLFRGKPDFEIFTLEMSDAATASRIHGEAFSRGWSDGEFASLISQPAVFGFLALAPGRPRDQAAGFVLVREAAGEAEILTIGVSPKARRLGLGWRLMQAAMREAVNRDAGEMFLEVDETNAAAVALYRRLGFQTVAERRAYYDNPGQPRTNALVMRRDFAGRKP